MTRTDSISFRDLIRELAIIAAWTVGVGLALLAAAALTFAMPAFLTAAMWRLS